MTAKGRSSAADEEPRVPGLDGPIGNIENPVIGGEDRGAYLEALDRYLVSARPEERTLALRMVAMNVLEARFQASGNGLHAWEALQISRLDGWPYGIPEWILEYLDGVAARLRRAERLASNGTARAPRQEVYEALRCSLSADPVDREVHIAVAVELVLQREPGRRVGEAVECVARDMGRSADVVRLARRRRGGEAREIVRRMRAREALTRP